MNETHLDFRLWGLWLHGAVPCGGPCDARNAVNGEEEAPNQPTPVNLPPDRTLMGQLWFLGTVSGLRKFWTNWTPGVCGAGGGHCGHGGVGSGRVPFAFIFSTVCSLPITGLCAIPDNANVVGFWPLALVLPTLSWERRSNAMIPNLAPSTQSEWRMMMKP